MQVARAQSLYLMNHVNYEMWHYIKKKQEVNTSPVDFVPPPQIHVSHSALACQSSSVRSTKKVAHAGDGHFQELWLYSPDCNR